LIGSNQQHQELLYELFAVEREDIDEKEKRERIRDYLEGMCDGFHGQRALKGPDEWRATLVRLSDSEDSVIRQKAIVLAALFGDPGAIKSLKDTTSDPNAPRLEREAALQVLVEAKVPGIIRLLDELLTDKAMRSPAIRALAALDDKRTPE